MCFLTFSPTILSGNKRERERRRAELREKWRSRTSGSDCLKNTPYISRGKMALITAATVQLCHYSLSTITTRCDESHFGPALSSPHTSLEARCARSFPVYWRGGKNGNVWLCCRGPWRENIRHHFLRVERCKRASFNVAYRPGCCLVSRPRCSLARMIGQPTHSCTARGLNWGRLCLCLLGCF